MTTSYKVKFWGIRTNTRPQGVGKKPRIVSHTVRWTVDNREKSSTFKTKGLAESFLSDLRQAARNGEAFDPESGLPGSMVKAKDTRTWYSLAVSYVHAWWPHAAAKTREGMTDSLAYITPVLTGDVSGRPDDEEIRRTLLEYSFVPEDRRPPPSPKVLKVVRWLEAASLPLSALEDPKHTRAALEAISLRLDGKAAAASTYRRKRAVFHQVLEYAVELGELSANPIHKVKFRKVKSTGEIDRRSVVSPEQARRLLVAVTYAGRTRGPMMAAMFACMYFAGLRPAEAAGLREANCGLPATGWGVLTLETTRPESNTRYTDSGRPTMSAASSIGAARRLGACRSRRSWWPFSASTSTGTASPRTGGYSGPGAVRASPARRSRWSGSRRACTLSPPIRWPRPWRVGRTTCGTRRCPCG
nr:hypothetical protein GCM10020093_068210 [Planobispora longispora]